MERTILIRIGEIFLKGNNKSYFISLLKRNIVSALFGLDYTMKETQNRYYLEEYRMEDEEEIIERLRRVFGIFSISPAYKVESNLDGIAKACVEISPKEGSFRVSVNRADKKIPKRSMDIAKDIGAVMLSAASGALRVDLFRFDFEVNVDIRENGYSYIFYQKIAGAGGLPVGCGGNGMLLLSGGIDSPVAGYLMAKRGVKLYAVHYHSFPYTSEQAKEKVIDLCKSLAKHIGEIQLFVVPFTDIQYAIKESCPIEYMITMMRRFMMRIAERLAAKNKCGALITGESLGQVASQTMESIFVTNSVVELPVFRPLIGNDKSDIIEISQKIGTYNISILPYEDCCTVFLPDHPVIRPKNELALRYETRLDIEGLIEKAMEGIELIHCRN